ncbi:MAG: FkbM family methyltransferase [Planctomycetes bacterium]|nr:FkbM family methyltransferase [Planctomycetota bacterium]
MLGRFYVPDGIDLVNLGDLRVFMLLKDNLYNLCVHLGARRYSLAKHYADVGQVGYPPSPAARSILDQTKDPKFCLYMILDHFLRHDLEFAFLDVGSFVGDVGLRYANFFRTLGVDRHVHCFDPTLSGQLVPYNIEINGLGRYVSYHPVAVSGVNGCMTFFERREHSDASSAVDSPGGIANSLVGSIRLSDFLRQHQIRNAFIKLDTENQEPSILADIGSFLHESVNAIAFECQGRDEGVFRIIAELSRTHYCFDVGYVPKPFLCQRISEEPGAMEAFQRMVIKRPYGYTDVLVLSRKTPGVMDLVRRLSALETRPVGYSLVFD